MTSGGDSISDAGSVPDAGGSPLAIAEQTGAEPASTLADARPPSAGGNEIHAAEISADEMPLGMVAGSGQPLTLGLESLRKHTAIFAGSGSGKTVLIRPGREVRAPGVSAIVLDPNNDLARLGDPWPEAPEHWARGRGSAAEYLANTDVVVWTPALAGTPASFQPLPDFARVLDDADEFNEAIEVAVASIVPRAKIDGTPQGSARAGGAQGGAASTTHDGSGGICGSHRHAGGTARRGERPRRPDRLAADLARSWPRPWSTIRCSAAPACRWIPVSC